MRDIADLTAALKTTATNIDTLVDLGIDAFVDLKHVITSLEEITPSTTSLEEMLQRHTVPAIIDAVLALGGHKPALVRTGLNSALEVKSGRRGRSSGHDRVVPANGHSGNGRDRNGGGDQVRTLSDLVAGALD